MIRKIKRKDKEKWIKLYCGYAKFYKVPMKQEILDTLWSWIHDENHVVNGICYEIEDKIVGIAHYRTMPRPIKGQYIGFLDDLFVDEHFRGKKIAQKLIKYLESLSKENNWDGIRWITHSSNETAKKNPYPPKIPCHRVIRTDGSLGGYSGKGGIKTKLRLLRSEKVDI